MMKDLFDNKLLTTEGRLGELDDDVIGVMFREGELYHPSPEDLQQSIKAFVYMWGTGSTDKFEGAPADNMYNKLVTLYNYEPEKAALVCETYLKLKSFLLISNV